MGQKKPGPAGFLVSDLFLFESSLEGSKGHGIDAELDEGNDGVPGCADQMGTGGTAVEEIIGEGNLQIRSHIDLANP